MSALIDAVAEIVENPQQRRAFESPSPCVVLAPPGSGKTKLLTTRLGYDLVHRIPQPHGAACITMTNAAAEELSARLAALGVERRSNLFVGTVHSFALRCVVRPYARIAGLDAIADAALAEEHDITGAFNAAAAELYGPYEDLVAVRETMNMRRNLLNYDEQERALGGPRLARLARRYEDLLLAAGCMDFHDLVRYAVQIVEVNEWARRALAARFPNLYVDEYQDLAPGLDRLVQALCFDESANAELFAVGDPDQAIFGFTGTAPHLLHELAQHPEVREVRLELNYRCGQALIDSSLQHLGEERTVRGRDAGGVIEARQCDAGFPDQCATAVELARQWVERGTELDEIAVLARAGWECDEVSDALRAAQLPVFIRRDRGFRSTPGTMLVEAMAAWATQPRDGRGVRLGDVLRRLRGLLRADHNFCTEVTGLMLRYRSLADDPATTFLDDLGALGLRRRLQTADRPDDLHQLSRMRRSVDAEGQLAGLTVSELGLRAKARGRVLVTTIHSAKGLEFDVVVVLGVDEGNIPLWRASTPQQVAEERRMFYVAITRAREAVYCLWTGWRDAKSGRRRHDGPSEYLVNLGLVS
jgi:DNA helicase II / ATP-dependent DNA helicase PcrA